MRLEDYPAWTGAKIRAVMRWMGGATASVAGGETLPERLTPSPYVALSPISVLDDAKLTGTGRSLAT